MTRTNTIARPRKTGLAKVDRKGLPPSKAATITKKSRLISLLSKKAGANITSISKKFGWLPHTTRAALSGLRKTGYEISSMKSGTGKTTKYHITSAPAEQSAQ